MPKNETTNSIVKEFASGKVRELYSFRGLIFKTSNRLSVFDVVISDNVPCKGAMLNCISQKNKVLLEKNGIKTDFIKVPKSFFKSAGFKTSELGNLSYGLYLDMIPAEIIVRAVLTGSLWKAYQNGEEYCGIKLPDGLKEGDMLPAPIITPTTKASSGHDKPVNKNGLTAIIVGWILENSDFAINGDVEEEFNNIVASIDNLENCDCDENDYFDVEDVLFGRECSDAYLEQIVFAIAHNAAKQYVDEIYDISLKAFNILSKKCADAGILFVDTKFEFGTNENGELILGDEVGTPDSSRFASQEEYDRTKRLVSMDKQIVRDYCKSIGFNGDEGQEIPEIPSWVWKKVTNTYIDLATKLCGKDVKKYL